MVEMIGAPTLTFQYNPDGELSLSSLRMEVPLTEDAPDVFRARFNRAFGEAGRDPGACWARLVALVAYQSGVSLDSDAARKDAWLCGLAPMPDWIREWLDDMALEVEIDAIPPARCITGAEADIEATYPGGYRAYVASDRATSDPETKGCGLDHWEE